MSQSQINPEFVTAMDLDRRLAPGVEVEARWTNSGNFYRAAGRVVRVNAASVRVALSEALSRGGSVLYPAGRELRIPRPAFNSGIEAWSYNNGVFPPKGD